MTSSLPKMGFLLLILAVAITGLPKLRSSLQVGFRSPPGIDDGQSDTEAEGFDSIAVTEDAEASDLDQAPQTPDEAPQSPDLAPQSDLEKIAPAQDADDDIALDGQTRDLLSIVADNSLRMSKREMPAYWELVRKSSKASFR